jgi:hypothetical protein
MNWFDGDYDNYEWIRVDGPSNSQRRETVMAVIDLGYVRCAFSPWILLC